MQKIGKKWEMGKGVVRSRVENLNCNSEEARPGRRASLQNLENILPLFKQQHGPDRGISSGR